MRQKKKHMMLLNIQLKNHLYKHPINQLIFFFNDPATTELYTLSLHDALPISSIVSGSSATDVAIVSSPTGPPRNLTIMVSRILRSRGSRPSASTSSIASAALVTARLPLPSALTSA